MSLDDLPTSSFADIAFQLIIFFILAMTLAPTEGFLTELPAGKKSEEKPEKTPTVQLHGEELRLNDKVTDLKGLREALAKLELEKKKGEAKVVLFEASGDPMYQGYFEVMAAISKAGGSICILMEDDSAGKEEDE
jgi:biopolymer transport protein ExbD